SEGLEERHLPVGERADLVPEERDRTQGHTVTEQGYRQRRAVASVLSLEHLAFRKLLLWHGADVVNMNGASVDDRSPGDRSTGQRQAPILEELTLPDGCGDRADARRDAERATCRR